MATIKPAVVSIIINSLYVLISTTPSTRLEAGGKRPPSCLGKHILQFSTPLPAWSRGRDKYILHILEFIDSFPIGRRTFLNLFYRQFLIYHGKMNHIAVFVIPED